MGYIELRRDVLEDYLPHRVKRKDDLPENSSVLYDDQKRTDDGSRIYLAVKGVNVENVNIKMASCNRFVVFWHTEQGNEFRLISFGDERKSIKVVKVFSNATYHKSVYINLFAELLFKEIALSVRDRKMGLGILLEMLYLNFGDIFINHPVIGRVSVSIISPSLRILVRYRKRLFDGPYFQFDLIR